MRPQDFARLVALGAMWGASYLFMRVAVPHLGYVEYGSLSNMFETIFDQVVAYANGKPINVQNPEALKAR